MTHRFARSLVPAAMLIAVTASVALGQQHEPDPQAEAAFKAMIDAYRERPALTVRTEVTIAIGADGAEQQGNEVEAELTFDRSGRGLFKLRGYECYVTEGQVTAVHAETGDKYFSMPDDGSPYYALMNMFLDVPFPHLAIALGEKKPSDLYMQFHPKAPWIVPTSVSTGERDDVTVQIIEMTSDFEDLEIALDPETKLIQSIDLEVTGGYLVQTGATLRYRHEFEYEMHDEVPRDDFFAFEPGDRQRVDMLASLDPPRRSVAAGQGDLVGAEAPGFLLETTTGDVIDLEDLRGQVVVLDFWATWCGPCIQALPKLHAVADWAREQEMPVQVLTINVFEGNTLPNDTPEARKEKAADFWRQRKFTLPVLMDYSDETAAAYGVNGIPSTVIIRSDGIVHAQHTGLSPEYEQMLKQEIADAIEALEIQEEADEGN